MRPTLFPSSHTCGSCSTGASPAAFLLAARHWSTRTHHADEANRKVVGAGAYGAALPMPICSDISPFSLCSASTAVKIPPSVSNFSRGRPQISSRELVIRSQRRKMEITPPRLDHAMAEFRHFRFLGKFPAVSEERAHGSRKNLRHKFTRSPLDRPFLLDLEVTRKSSISDQNSSSTTRHGRLRRRARRHPNHLTSFLP